MNLNLLWKFSCKSAPEGYFQWSGSCTVKSDFKGDGFKVQTWCNLFSLEFCD